jgi:hypothetical protein
VDFDFIVLILLMVICLHEESTHFDDQISFVECSRFMTYPWAGTGAVLSRPQGAAQRA